MSDKEMSIAEMLKNRVAEQKKEDELDTPEKYDDAHIKNLTDCCQKLLRPISDVFKVGDLVKWKNGLKNRKLPKKYQPAVVVAVLDTPILNIEDNSGSPYFREPLDIVLGVVSEDGVFNTYYYDKRRFTSFE